MGQKVNPNIFRLGINKTWKTEFFEKKRHELPLYTFKDLEIKGYVERFLEIEGILLHDYKLHYSNSTLNLYISYFVSSEFMIGKKDKVEGLTLIDASGNMKHVVDTKIPSQSSFFKFTPSLFKSQTTNGFYKIKKYLKYNKVSPLDKEITFNQKIDEKALNIKVEGVFNNLFKVLSLFTNNKFNIIINFRCLNKDLGFLKRTQKKNFILLQKFKGTPFLKEGIELLFHTVTAKSSASLLAKFIALQIKKAKRHKFLLAFLKQTLTILSKSNFSKVKGIKIIVKGRLNGVPRARHKIVTIGDVPVQSISEIIDFSQVTTHNSNGSYGVKVWIIEKDSIS